MPNSINNQFIIAYFISRERESGGWWLGECKRNIGWGRGQLHKYMVFGSGVMKMFHILMGGGRVPEYDTQIDPLYIGK